MRAGERFRDDDRGAMPLAILDGGTAVFGALVVAVLGGPLVVALVGSYVQRSNAFRFLTTGAAALVAVFTLTGTTQFAPRWTVVGILAVLAAIGAHVWQFRDDRLTFVIVASIYVMPASLASVLLVQVLF